MQRYPITKQAYERMEAELKELKEVKRPEVIEEIAVAREHGDLKENAEYHAAKEKQAFLEGRISDLEARQGLAEIIDPAAQEGNEVKFGATVTLEDLETEQQKTYQIVGEYEADLDKGLIAFTTPIAKAMIGKSEGDDFEVQLPKGLVEYEIIKVEYR